jgi:hypothetical protein
MSTVITDLPNELLDAIVSFICDHGEFDASFKSCVFPGHDCQICDRQRQAALKALCLTSRRFHTVALPHLYHHLSPNARWWSLLRTLAHRPNLGHYARSLCWTENRSMPDASTSQELRQDSALVDLFNTRREEYFATCPRTSRTAYTESRVVAESLVHFRHLLEFQHSVPTDFLTSILPNLEVLAVPVDIFYSFRFCRPGSLPRLRHVHLRSLVEGEGVSAFWSNRLFAAARDSLQSVVILTRYHKPHTLRGAEATSESEDQGEVLEQEHDSEEEEEREEEEADGEEEEEEEGEQVADNELGESVSPLGSADENEKDTEMEEQDQIEEEEHVEQVSDSDSQPDSEPEPVSELDEEEEEETEEQAQERQREWEAAQRIARQEYAEEIARYSFTVPSMTHLTILSSLGDPRHLTGFLEMFPNTTHIRLRINNEFNYPFAWHFLPGAWRNRFSSAWKDCVPGLQVFTIEVTRKYRSWYRSWSREELSELEEELNSRGVRLEIVDWERCLERPRGISTT